MSLPPRVNSNTIQDKVLVGYQGWFTCAGDGPPLDPGHHGWLHWFNFPIPAGGRPNLDLWPDVSAYDPSELFPAPGLATASGDPVYLFSSRHPKTVQRHFHWMAQHGVDGAFLQRFAGQTEVKPGNIAIRDLRDEVGDRVREAAEAEGRVFAIMYDVSGVSPDKIQTILERDWTHLLRDKHILDSPSYLREEGRPVVALWGFGLNDRNHTPDLVRAITGFFRSFTPGGVYLMAGTPGHWRTSTSDADRNPEFVKVWTECFDAISPWTVGRFGNEEEADRWGKGRLKADAEYLSKLASEGGRKVDYIPVVLPGGSGFNLSEGKWHMNDMKRNGGRFLWRQLYNAQRAGVRTIYGAMWDEYDEGTVYMPVVSHASQLPVHPSFRFLALDVDGLDLPSDWYMRVMGLAAEAFHGERTLEDTLPVDELGDYWKTRPRSGSTKSAGNVGTAQTGEKVGHEKDQKQDEVDAIARSLKEWELSEGRGDIPTDTPPPYSLEDMSSQQCRPSIPVAGSSTGTMPPPIRRETRPSASIPASLVVGSAVAVAATAAAVAASSGRKCPPPPGRTSKPNPPAVNPSSRPPAPPAATTRPAYPSPPGMRMPQSPPLPGLPPLPQLDHDSQMPYGQPTSMYPPPMVPPPMGAPPMPMGPPPVGYHGRGRSQSPSRRHQYKGRRSHSRSRSRSRSSSRGGRSHPHSHSYAPMHGHTQSLGSGHAHGHGHGYGPGYDHGSAHSQSFSQGYAAPHYAPAQSHPVGGYGSPPASASGSGPGYAGQGQPGYAPPGPGYGGYGQGYGQGGQPAYGYTSHPPTTGYYPGPGQGYPAGGNNAGGGGGAIATALHAVEGIAGRQTREQLEKTVGSLLNKFR